MIDPAVERQYADSKELLILWRTFHDFFVMGVKGEGLSPEKEEQFLELKSRIAMLHDSFMEALTHDQNIGQEVLNIITRSITLKHLGKQSTADIKKMEIEWHESYLLLNETIGALEDKRTDLLKVNKTQYQASRYVGVLQQKLTKFFTSFYFKVAVVLVIVLFGTAGVQVMGIYDYDELGNQPWAKTPYRTFKNLWRKMVNEDATWCSIDVQNRKPEGQWPSGLKVPAERLNDDKATGYKNIPSFAEKFSKAVEYQHERSSRQFKGNLDLYTYRFADTASARSIMTDWEAFSQTPAAKSVSLNTRMHRDANIITILNSSNEETLRLATEGLFD